MFLSADGGRYRILLHRLPGEPIIDVSKQLWWALSNSPILPPRGPPLTFLSVDGGCFWILRQHLPGGPPSMFLSVDGGRSRIL
jgi:hypothetical protein